MGCRVTPAGAGPPSCTVTPAIAEPSLAVTRPTIAGFTSSSVLVTDTSLASRPLYEGSPLTAAAVTMR